MPTPSQFSAADSAIGYLYQVRVALLWALRKLRSGCDYIISLETLDDVTFETKDGKPEELLQLKHHRNREAVLTDASTDLWKSLRVWFEGYATGEIPAGTELYLLTTATAPEGSIASYLRPENRDVDLALDKLTTTAQSSISEVNASAYTAYLHATIAERKMVIDNVVVLDASPMIQDLDGAFKTELFLVVNQKHQSLLLERLEGWWFRRILVQLASASRDNRILAVEIEAQVNDLREQFKADSLPIDEDLALFNLDESTCEIYAGSVFVWQLEIIRASTKRILAAIRDYYRAFEQRSRWLRNDLLYIGDLGKYERRLVEEWELAFAQITDEVGKECSEEIKQKAARNVLTWAESMSCPIRPQVIEPFVSRGSLHMLADEGRVGWHPEFLNRLAAFLEHREGVV